jgi:hypothetical protein
MMSFWFGFFVAGLPADVARSDRHMAGWHTSAGEGIMARPGKYASLEKPQSRRNAARDFLYAAGKSLADARRGSHGCREFANEGSFT